MNNYGNGTVQCKVEPKIKIDRQGGQTYILALRHDCTRIEIEIEIEIGYNTTQLLRGLCCGPVPMGGWPPGPL